MRHNTAMSEASESAALESDPNWPSGPWTGFFIQTLAPAGKHRMDLRLTFQQGVLTGEGRDWVGQFLFRGSYDVATGQCHWTKRYLGKHDVFYKGFNEGKGIWGVWEIPATPGFLPSRGGFHIWPEGMPDPSGDRLTEEADLPVEQDELVTADR